MKLLNKDLTKERITMYVINNQIYAEVFHMLRGKWTKEIFFKDFGFMDEELKNIVKNDIISIFELKNPNIDIIDCNNIAKIFDDWDPYE